MKAADNTVYSGVYVLVHAAAADRVQQLTCPWLACSHRKKANLAWG